MSSKTNTFRPKQQEDIWRRERKTRVCAFWY